jgi:radical SAM protein with 4Fe4S-binding SPASM domain
MASNLASLRAFPSILADIGVKTYAVQPLVDWSPALVDERLYVHTWESNVITAIKVDCEARGIICVISPQTEMELVSPKGAVATYYTQSVAQTNAKPCIIPFESAYVDSTGQVFPCCHSAGKAVLGNLRDNTLDEIMNGPVMRKFQEDLLDAATTPSVCRTCNVVPLGPHPFRSYRARIVEISQSGDTYHLVAENLGTLAWDDEREIRVSATRPRDRVSRYHHQTWINGGRIARARERVVKPGEFATFDFTITPTGDGDAEWFQLLVEYHTWLPDTFFRLPA